MKNFRPIWTIRMRSSSMILRKCRTENPAISAAFGMSRNVFFTAIPSVDFIGSSFFRGGKCTVGSKVKRGVTTKAHPFISSLLFAHVGISVVGRRYEVFFDRAGTDPTEQV